MRFVQLRALLSAGLLAAVSPLSAQIPQTEYAQRRAALAAKIQDGVLSPGEWLREMPICEEYGVGRSITRSALRELAEDGLIHIEEKRGGYVAATTVQEVFDLYEARAALYGLAARFACIRSDGKFMAETLQLIDELFIDTEGGEVSAEELIHQSEAIFSRLVSVSFSVAPRSRLKKPPGIRPAAANFSW